MFPAWSWLIGFWIGASIGSFLNVVVYRLPRGLSISEPKNSFCPNCKKRLTVLDLIPILSWVLMRGRCSGCKQKISARYPLVELVTAVLFSVIWYQQLVVGEDWVTALGYSFFAAALVAAIFTDLYHYIIPDEVNASMLVIGIGYNVALYVQGRDEATTWGIPSALVGAVVGLGILWFVAFLGRLMFGKDAMGHGDLKMIRGIGSVVFVMGVTIGIGLAVVAGAVIGSLHVLFRKLSGKEAKEELVEGEGCEAAEEAEYQPESLGSLLKSGLGYLLLIDVIGLFIPNLYRKWFGEEPRIDEEIDPDFEVELTQIPFGPYLAVGALCVLLFPEYFQSLVTSYWDYMLGEP